MFVYDVFVNDKYIETLKPCCQGSMEMYEWGSAAWKKLSEEHKTKNIVMNRKWVTPQAS